MKKVLAMIGVIILACIIIFIAIYAGRIATVASIEKITNYEDGYNLYSMHVKYDYDLEKLLSVEVKQDSDYMNAFIKEVFPLLPVKVETPEFGCSAFSLETTDGQRLMGRNYDFPRDTSAMLVYCEPKGGYKSISFAALDNLQVKQVEENLMTRLKCLASPFTVLDGMNEKGVSMAVLALDSDATRQDGGKPDLITTVAIRLVLDQAATTREAIDLLNQYDMYAVAGIDYHFFITDASGDSVIVEYDPCDPARKMVVTEHEACTNFYAMYADKVLPNQRNGIYGHGKERYDSIMKVLGEHAGAGCDAVAWEALQAASQLPKPNDNTSNTQWSIVFDDTDLTADIVLRRNWDDVYSLFLQQ